MDKPTFSLHYDIKPPCSSNAGSEGFRVNGILIHLYRACALGVNKGANAIKRWWSLGNMYYISSSQIPSGTAVCGEHDASAIVQTNK